MTSLLAKRLFFAASSYNPGLPWDADFNGIFKDRSGDTFLHGKLLA